MRSQTKYLVLCFLLITCVGCDQMSKHYAKTMLEHRGPLSFFSDMLRLHYAENPGVAFSLGAHWPEHWRMALFVVGTSVCLTALLLYIVRTDIKNSSHLLALNLIFAGGIGNLIDRIFREGRVIDFLNIGIGDFRSAIFNVADIAITTGMIVLLLTSFGTARDEMPGFESVDTANPGPDGSQTQNK
jgi:signal peptidase II